MLSLPQSFKEKYIRLLGKAQAEKMFAAMNETPKKAFRINSLKNKTKITYSLDQKVPIIPHAYYGPISGQDPEWVSGLIYSQDPAAMFPAYIANVKPGDKVLDLCAAPGGKTTALGEELKGQGLLVANEISTSRAKVLRENLERWGITNALITNDDTESLAQNFPAFFDLILVDAPCSGEGMFRKNPVAAHYWSPEYVLKCAQRQKDILTWAVKMLKPNGKLVYSTCTFSPEEDEQIVSWLVQEKGLQIEKINNVGSKQIDFGHPEWTKEELPALKNTLRFWPQDGIGEGQYVALLSKKAGAVNLTSPRRKKRKKQRNKLALTKGQKDLVKQVLIRFNLPDELTDWENKALTRQDHVFLPAIDTQNLKGIRILNNGVELGLLKKKRFEPSHQLAEVLGQKKQANVINLSSSADYLSYLHGETLRLKTTLRGYVLVSYQHMIFSFGNMTGNGVLKNFYPKGLRILKKEETDD